LVAVATIPNAAIAKRRRNSVTGGIDSAVAGGGSVRATAKNTAAAGPASLRKMMTGIVERA